jgi:MYXO-CTERM domain-containing protein
MTRNRFRALACSLALALCAPPAAAAGPYVTLHDDGSVAAAKFTGQADVDVVAAKILSFYQASGAPIPDIMSVWTAFPTDGNSIETIFEPFANDATGLGLNAFYKPEVFASSTPPLRSMLLHNDVTQMAARAKYQNAPVEGYARYLFLLELSHNWGPAIKSTGSKPDQLIGIPYHWSFWVDAGGSPAGGNRWQDNGDGTFTTLPAAPLTIGYSMLDLYLMGLAAPSEVPPFGVLDGAVGTALDPFTGKPVSAQTFAWFGAPLTVTAKRKALTIDQIIGKNGPRVPDDASAPKSFTLGIVLLVGQDATPEQVAGYEATFDPIAASLAPAFGEATLNRGTMVTVTGTPAQGGAGGTGGAGGAAGAGGTSGDAGMGDAGEAGSAGDSGQGGAGDSGQGGAPAPGAAGVAGGPGAAGTPAAPTPAADSADDGCSCAMIGASPPAPLAFALALGSLAVIGLRRRRARRA